MLNRLARRRALGALLLTLLQVFKVEQAGV